MNFHLKEKLIYYYDPYESKQKPKGGNRTIIKFGPKNQEWTEWSTNRKTPWVSIGFQEAKNAEPPAKWLSIVFKI